MSRSDQQWEGGGSFMQERLREGVLIITTAISIFLLLSLVTYHRSDPGWSQISSSNQVANAAGYVGSWLADVLLCIFGYMAYLFPILLACIAWLPLTEKAEEDEEDWSSYRILLIRLLGFVLILAAGSALSSIYFSVSSLPVGAGGIIGSVLSANMLHIFNLIGTSLILLALILSGSTIFIGVSWFSLVDFVGFWTLYALGVLRRWLLDVNWSSLFKHETEEYEQPAAKPEIVKYENKVKSRIATKKTKQQVAYEEDDDEEYEYEDDEELPSLELLDEAKEYEGVGYSNDKLEDISREVELRLQDFNIDAQVVAVHPGPVVTRFELQPAAGTKVSKITNLAKDLARSLSVTSVRIVEVIPGKSVIGLELPNQQRETVRLREILASDQFEDSEAPLTIVLGKDIAGHPVVVDLAKMPHLLVAGTTGSGKSVALNAMLMSLLYKYTPEKMRLILIDPKMLELSVYDGIPHLLAPVVTDMKEATNALRWCVAEMERRYKLLASLGVRSIAGYNAKVAESCEKGAPLLDPLWQADESDEPEELRELPYIVVFADEYADMMMVVGKKVEELIARIAQKARAAGIHLVLATQRPSVDVITGLIKANIPTRVALQVSSRVDSRTILDQCGAEQLLGQGDMLYLPPGTAVPVRVHGAFVADNEVHRVVKEMKAIGEEPEYCEEILDGSVGGIPGIDADADIGGDEDDDPEQDELYDEAVKFVTTSRRASVSSLQRRLRIGYNRSARIVEAMEAAGIVGPMEGNGCREVLAPPPVGD